MQLPTDQSGFILNEKASSHFWEGQGLLSIKSFFHGQALYDTGKGLHAVNEKSYLILNNEQSYAITIDSEREVESFCIFFKPGFAEDVWHSLNASHERLLENPTSPLTSQINFFERNYPHDETLSPVLLVIRSSIADHENDPGWLEEHFHLVMCRLLEVHRKTLRAASAVGAVRASTREELYRRLLRAKDFISASYDGRISLAEMAAIACLSPNHFLRTFRQTFHQTPHQFLTSIRLGKAKEMLSETDHTVTEIGLSVGFESLSSFSRLFALRFGRSPQTYRRSKR